MNLFHLLAPEMIERVHKTEMEKRLLPFISISENSKTISKLNSEGLRSCGLPLRPFPLNPSVGKLIIAQPDTKNLIISAQNKK